MKESIKTKFFWDGSTSFCSYLAFRQKENIKYLTRLGCFPVRAIGPEGNIYFIDKFIRV